MPKSTSRSHSNAELLQQTTENLYSLGLLNDTPRSRDRLSSAAPNRSAQCKTFARSQSCPNPMSRDLFQASETMD